MDESPPRAPEAGAVLAADLDRLRSELRRVEQEARLASADRTRFLAAASHDLLQPLNAARLYTSSLVEQARGTGFAELAGMIEASLGAVEEIMGSLLDLSRLDSGTADPQPTSFRVAELLERARVEFEPVARGKGVRLRVVSSSAAVLTDRVMAGRIVRNLVSNAVKYTPGGGRVLVGVRRRAGTARLDVIDTGIGIAAAQQSLIFGEFTRLDAGARIARGLGLGLSIVQRLVQALGLGLDLRSEPGRGSRFSLALPLSAAPPERTPAPEAMDARDLLALSILVVDNDPAILGGMSRLLGGWGCDVRAVPSLRAISRDRVLDRWLPDLVLMDFHLDQTSGLDAIEWLHQNLGGHVPAALLTADRTDAVGRLAGSRGIPILHKPVRPAALRALLAAVKAGTWPQGEPEASRSS